MNISTYYLKTFMVLCESKSFSETSAIVHKSQSGVSAQIAKLEQEIGVKLIHRVSREFGLAEGGEVLLAYAKEILSKTDELRASIRELETGRTKTSEVEIVAISPVQNSDLWPSEAEKTRLCCGAIRYRSRWFCRENFASRTSLTCGFS